MLYYYYYYSQAVWLGGRTQSCSILKTDFWKEAGLTCHITKAVEAKRSRQLLSGS